MLPSLVIYTTEAEYRQHYERNYCRKTIHTFDGFRVFFPKHAFGHAFYESANRKARDKSVFSHVRAERMDWIHAALTDSSADLYAGWLRDKKRYDLNRRVTLIFGNFVVVLFMNRKKMSATFITAYVANASTVAKIRKGSRWR